MDHTLLNALERKILIAGTEYILCALLAIDYAEIERRILSSRPNHMLAIMPILKGLPSSDPLRREMAEKAYDDSTKARILTGDQLDEWRNSLPGIYFMFYLQIRQRHPDVNEDMARVLCQQLARDYIEECLQELKKHSTSLNRNDVAEIIANSAIDKRLRILVGELSGIPDPDPMRPSETGAVENTHSLGPIGIGA